MGKKETSEIMLIFMLLGMLTFSIQLGRAQLAARKAGVNAGYWIKYGLSATWESSDPDTTTPQYILDSQQLAYFSNVVQSVSGTNVTFNSIKHFQNGTEKSETRWIDADSGHAGTGSASGYLSFIAANLSAGDLIYTGLGAGVGQINETITRVYLGQPVEINHVNGTTSSSAYFLYVDTYWNRATGALYEVYENHTGYTTKGETTYATIETTHIYVVGGVPDSNKPAIGDINIQPSSPTPEDDVTVSVLVSDDGSGVKEAHLYYSIDGGSTWSQVSMTVVGSTYEATIPRQNDSVAVQYYIAAFDDSMNKATSAAKSYTVTKRQTDTPVSFDPFLIAVIGAIIAALGVGAFLVQRKRRTHH